MPAVRPAVGRPGRATPVAAREPAGAAHLQVMDTTKRLDPAGPALSRDPATYAGEPVCPRCGSGWPCCTDRRPDGTKFTHAETCERYRDTDDVCASCETAMQVGPSAILTPDVEEPTC